MTTSHTPSLPAQCIAFNGLHKLASGSLADVAVAVHQAFQGGGHPSILIFDAQTSELREVDTRGTAQEVAARYASAPAVPAAEPHLAADDTPRGPGRPKLGVVAREVTLLPRHWEWLGTQPGGASVALRKLVEEARRANVGRDQARVARERTYRFMTAISSGLDTFEEATRALFAGDRPRFEGLLQVWPADVAAHALSLAQGAFDTAA